MAFQFSCPCGGLLQAEPSQIGQQCRCPYCNTVLVVPADPLGGSPAPQQPEGWGGPQFGPGAGGFPGVGPPSEHSPEQAAPVGLQDAPQSPASPFDPTGRDAENQLLHIPCPNGHVLDVDPEMIGQDVLCPYCEARFTLQKSNSLEHLRREEIEQARRDAKAGKLWLTWAVIFAVLVFLGLGIAIAASNLL
jgi:uncharacterized Zn-finger protein